MRTWHVRMDAVGFWGVLALAGCILADSSRADEREEWPAGVPQYPAPQMAASPEKVYAQYVSTVLDAEAEEGQGDGVRLKTVRPGGRADRAGLQPGDWVRYYWSQGEGDEPDWIPGLAWLGRIVSLAAEARETGLPILVQRGQERILRLIDLKDLEPAPIYDRRPEPFQHCYTAQDYLAAVEAVHLARSLLGITTADDPARNNFIRGVPVINGVLLGQDDWWGRSLERAPDEPRVRLVRFKRIYDPDLKTAVFRNRMLTSGTVELGHRLKGVVTAIESAEGPRERDQIGHVALSPGGAFDFNVQLARILPIETETHHRPSPQLFMDLAPEDLWTRNLGPEVTGLVARYILLCASAEGEPSLAFLTRARELSDEAHGLAQQRKIRFGRQDDRQVAARVAYLAAFRARADSRGRVQRFLQDYLGYAAVALGGKGPACDAAAAGIRRMAEPATQRFYSVRPGTRLPGPADKWFAELQNYTAETNRVRHIQDAFRLLARAHDIRDRLEDAAREIDTNTTRDAQRAWLAIYQALQVLRRDVAREELLPGPVEVRTPPEENEVLNPEDAIVAAVVEWARTSCPPSHHIPVCREAMAYLSSRQPLYWGALRESLQAAGYLLAAKETSEKDAALALCLRARFLGSKMPPGERDRLLKLASETRNAEDKSVLLAFASFPIADDYVRGGVDDALARYDQLCLDVSWQAARRILAERRPQR